MESSNGTTADISPDIVIPTAPAKDLSAADILGASDIKRERLYVPEWGGYVYIKTMSGTERDEFEMSLLSADMETRTTENIRAKLLVHAFTDASGNPIFTLADVAALGRKSAAALSRCYNVASKLNRVSNADVDELAKN